MVVVHKVDDLLDVTGKSGFSSSNSFAFRLDGSFVAIVFRAFSASLNQVLSLWFSDAEDPTTAQNICFAFPRFLKILRYKIP